MTEPFCICVHEPEYSVIEMDASFQEPRLSTAGLLFKMSSLTFGQDFVCGRKMNDSAFLNIYTLM